jgi:hypothetical protein
MAVTPYPYANEFLGYPTITKKADGNYLIVFTDRYGPSYCKNRAQDIFPMEKQVGNEDADLFQFDITNYLTGAVLSGQTASVDSKGYINLSSTESYSYVVDGNGATGGIATISAGDYVRLLPGFHAKNGSQFHATVNPALKALSILRNSPSPFDNYPDFICANENTTQLCSSGGGRVSTRHDQEDIGTKSIDASVQLYPNPATQQTNIRFEDVRDIGDSGHVRLYNTLGVMVRSETRNFRGGILTIDLTGLPKGVYIVEIDFEIRRPIRKTVIVE